MQEVDKQFDHGPVTGLAWDAALVDNEEIAISLKCRLFSIRFKTEAFETARKMSLPTILTPTDQERIISGLPTIRELILVDPL